MRELHIEADDDERIREILFDINDSQVDTIVDFVYNGEEYDLKYTFDEGGIAWTRLIEKNILTSGGGTAVRYCSVSFAINSLQ